MQKHIGKKLPLSRKLAQKMGVQGRWNVMFVIQKDEALECWDESPEIKNLEEECSKDYPENYPKWTPAENQRGKKAVLVTILYSNYFKLQ